MLSFCQSLCATHNRNTSFSLHTSLVPRPSHHPVFDHELQAIKNWTVHEKALGPGNYQHAVLVFTTGFYVPSLWYVAMLMNNVWHVGATYRVLRHPSTKH